jgi:hypothetical protein
VVLREGRRVTGRVIDAESGEGIAGAEVGSGWTLRRSVRTREDGSFEYPAWSSEGVVVMAARAVGYSRGRVRVGTSSYVELLLARAGAVFGTVTDSAGKPLAGVLLALRARDAAANFVTYLTGETDIHGAFRFDSVGLREPHTLTVVASGHGRRLVDFDMPASPESIDLGDIRLGAPHRIEGRVVLAGDRPGANVLVKLEGANADRGARRSDEAVPYKTGGTVEHRRTDDLGRFRFPDLASGAYTVTAEPSGSKPVSVEVELGEGQTCDDVVITIAGGRKLAVILVDPAGGPVEGVHAQVHMADSWWLQSMTDASGTARFETDSEILKVTLFDFSDRFVLPDERRVQSGEDEVRMVLEPSAEITGTVRARDGTPLPQAALRIEQDGKPVPQQGGGGGWSDMEGKFRVRVPQRGLVSLFLTGSINEMEGVNDHEQPGFTGSLLAVSPGAMGLVLQAKDPEYARSLRVRVRAPDGSPLASAQVYADHFGKLVPGANKRSDADGWALLENLPDADIAVYARVLPDAVGAGDWLRETVWPVRAGGQEIEMRLRGARRIRGVVRLGEEPQAEVFVAIYKESAMLTSVQSAADGSFELAIDEAESKSLWLHAAWRGGDGTMYQARLDQFDPESKGPVELTLAPPK